MLKNEEVISILKAVKVYPVSEGANLGEICQVLDIPLPKRTLQRRLAELIESGHLRSMGDKRARRYFIINKKIEYQRSFLDAYEPNVTYYLSKPEREQLLQWGTPLVQNEASQTFAKYILHKFLLDLSWNSSRLEGNTYSLLETERLLNSGEIAENKNPLDTQMLLNHKEAIEFLIDQGEYLIINSPTILNLHALLSNGLLGNQASCGRLRNIPVGIGKTTYVPLAIPQLIEEIFRTILQKAQTIHDPFEQSFFLMAHLPYLQPFEDVNKRVSRLSANIPLIRDNLCPLTFVGMDEKAYIEAMLRVYERNQTGLLKEVYLSAYEQSCKRYATIPAKIGEPDLIHFKYREQISPIVRAIILQRMNKKLAIAFIENEIHLQIPESDQQHCIEVIDNELMTLHLGNIARYKITAEEYEQWKKQWN